VAFFPADVRGEELRGEQKPHDISRFWLMSNGLDGAREEAGG
jgi:hypothetical protein